MINSVVSKYRIKELLGKGGMASVYKAEHIQLGTEVAIKVLNPILTADERIRDRFANEAKTMASLNHPNITKVIDFDDQPEQLSIIMELLEGEDMDQRINRIGPLSILEIQNIFPQVLSAFQYAHEKGVVHRDIKPSNIFILPDGKVKILDFGIAKLFGQGAGDTQTGAFLGTVVYMSPEQVKADKSIDHRSDIYSIGLTLYHAIKGKTPYDTLSDSQFDILNKIVAEPIPEITENDEINKIVSRACQKDREKRFQNCIEFEETFASIFKTKSQQEAVSNAFNEGDAPLQKELVDALRWSKIAFYLSVFNVLLLILTPEMEKPKIISFLVAIATVQLSLKAQKHSIENLWMSNWALYSSLFIIGLILIIYVLVYSF